MAKTRHKPTAAKRQRVNGRRTAGRTPMFAMRADPEAVERWRIAARKRGETLSDFMRLAAEERAGGRNG